MLKTDYEFWLAITEEDEREWTNSVFNQEPYNELITLLLQDVWVKSHETREHGERIAELSWLIGRRMGLQPSQLQDLVLLARLHDLGKTLIPDTILNKCGPLSESEWAKMKAHSDYGYSIARNSPDIQHISAGILFHHERWDGQGYPHGLSGKTIPLSARIIAVADAFETMTHDRSYRQAIDVDRALSELRFNAGKQFDPAIVSALMKICKKAELNIA